MGAVYLALASGSGDFEKLVVLKELRQDLALNQKVVALFLQEAKLAGRLNHANIVQTLEAGNVDGRYFLAMEYLDGQPLSKLIQNDGARAIPLLLRLQVIADVLSGLHYAHELQDFDQTPLLIVHCDVSPSNVFVTYDGSVKVIDFGVAKAAGRANESRGFQGKVRYASPEQLRGGALDRRADVFSAGILLWEAVTRRRFVETGISDELVMRRRLSGAETKVAMAASEVDPALLAICDRALRINPDERYSTAEEFRVTLVDYCSTLGSRMDPGDIARLLRSEFAVSRAKTHTLVRSQLASATGSSSIPQLMDKDMKHDDVTTVADLSTFVRASRDSNPSVDLDEEAMKRRPRPWLIPVLVGGVSLSILGAVSLFSSKNESKSEESSDVSNVVDVDTNDSSPEAAEAHDSEAVPRTRPRSEEETLDAGSEAERDPLRSPTLRNPTLRNATQRTNVARNRDQGSSRTQVRTPAASAPPTAAPPAPAQQVPAATEPQSATPPTPAAKASVFDQELKETEPRNQRRALDDDNPFRK